MTEVKFSERVNKVLKIVRTSERLGKKSILNLYDNALIATITEAEREAVMEALEQRMRSISPAKAKSIFGPKDSRGRILLAKIHDELAAELDLRSNTVGDGVKTGGDMLRGENHVSIYISYKNEDQIHVSLGYTQKSADTDPYLVVRCYQTGGDADQAEFRQEFQESALDDAKATYRDKLKGVL